MALFRTQAVEYAAKRLSGQVILATPLSLRIYAVLAIIAVTTVVIFLSTASYSRQETVIGWLVPRGGLIQVDARAGGVVTGLAVKEGDSVHAGELIARVRLSTTLASGEDAGAASSAALSSESAAIKAQAEAARKKLLAEQADLGPKLEDLEAQAAETHRQIGLQERQVAIAKEDLARFKRLADAGDISERLVGDREANLLSAQQSLSRLKAEELSLRQQAADVTARLHAIPSELAQAGAGEASAQAQVAQKRVQSNIQDSDLVVASVSGRILAIPVDVGQTLAPGTTIAIVAPRNSHLEAELYAPSRAAGFVQAGEKVRLKYQAFPYEKFGSAHGIVTSISRTILAPSDVAIPSSGIQQPVFRVRAALTQQNMHAYGQTIPLQPGMLLSADIVLDRRTLIEWLFDPIYAAVK